jgi:CDP-diacylglycerol--glycerol-3-phosphate 3-phosphatidyltransferase
MNLLAAAMFLLIVATDALDGYLARRFDRVTDLGKLLDPMVDKVLMTATMVAISFVYPLMWVLVLLTLVRDVSVTIMRGRALKRLCIISADKFGKLKMIAQSVGLLLLLLPYNVFVLYVAIVMLMLALILTIVSWVKYNTRYRTILVSAS